MIKVITESIDKNNLKICIEAWEGVVEAKDLNAKIDELTNQTKDEFARGYCTDEELISQDYYEGYTLAEAFLEAQNYAEELPGIQIKKVGNFDRIVLTWVQLLIYDEEYDEYVDPSMLFAEYENDPSSGLFSNVYKK